MRYAELQVTTNFSFLRGASHADELVAQAKFLDMLAIAVCDRNTLAGVVRAHVTAKNADLRLIVGARLDLQDAPSQLCFPTNRAAYGRLCRLLSLGQGRAEKGQCTLSLADVTAHADGNIFIAVAPGLEKGVEGDIAFEGRLRHIKAAISPSPLYLTATHRYRGDDHARIAALAGIARRSGTPLVATNDVLYHAPHRRPLQDVLTCIRHHTTIAEAGFLLEANAERHLKKPAEMARLFAGFEDAIARTAEIADACRFSLDELVYDYPDEPVPPGATPQAHLESLAMEGARWRFPDGVPPKVQAVIVRELKLIDELGFAPYFLTVLDIVNFARSRSILCQGRGSAANSVVC